MWRRESHCLSQSPALHWCPGTRSRRKATPDVLASSSKASFTPEQTQTAAKISAQWQAGSAGEVTDHPHSHLISGMPSVEGTGTWLLIKINKQTNKDRQTRNAG